MKANRDLKDPELRADILRLHREGKTLREIEAWLLEQRGIRASYRTVARTLERTQVARGQMASDPPPPTPSPLLAPDLPLTDEDELAAIRRELAIEVREAAANVDEDWKRYHSARSLQLRALAMKIGSKPPADLPGDRPSEKPPHPQPLVTFN